MNLMKTIQKIVLHKYAENEPAMKRNDVVLNELVGELYIKETHEKIPDNCKYPLATIQSAHYEKQTQKVYQSCLS